MSESVSKLISVVEEPERTAIKVWWGSFSGIMFSGFGEDAVLVSRHDIPREVIPFRMGRGY